MSSARRSLMGRRAVQAGWAAGLLGIGLSLAAPSALATDYELNPWVSLGAGYDDNITFAPSGTHEIAAAGPTLDARADFLAAEGNWQWLVRPEARGSWYPSQTEVDSNGEFLNLNAQYTGQRSTLILGGYASSQSLVTDIYLPTAAIGSGLGVTEPGTTLGTPTSSLRQNLGSLTPSYTLQMTPRTGLQLNGTYTDASYDRTVVGWIGYEDVTGSAGLVLAANPTDSLTLRATAAEFRPDSGRTADTYGPQVEWDGKYSQTKQYYLRIGAERTDFSGSLAGAAETSSSTPASSNTTWTAGAGTHWTYVVTEIFVDATRDVAPTPQGYAVIEDQLRLRLARRFTPRFAAFLGARAIYEQPLSGDIASGTTVHAQHYNYGMTGFEWRVRREFSVIGTYSFTEYHYNAPPAQANSVQLSVVYEPHRPAEGPAITVGY